MFKWDVKNQIGLYTGRCFVPVATAPISSAVLPLQGFPGVCSTSEVGSLVPTGSGGGPAEVRPSERRAAAATASNARRGWGRGDPMAGMRMGHRVAAPRTRRLTFLRRATVAVGSALCEVD